jgi:predicted MFS family arabinose efflux permease
MASASAPARARQDRPATETSARGALPRAAGLALGPAVALGIARFAYSLLLPAMRADLGWSYAQAGALNSANAAGYLIGAVTGAGLARRAGARRAFIAGLAVTVVSVLASAATGNLILLSLLRVLSGASGAVVFIVGAALTSQLASAGGTSHQPALLLGIYFAGAGAGIVASGAVVPAVLDATGTGGWPLGWLALGALALGASAIAARATRDAPVPPPAPPQGPGGWRPARLVPIAVGYGLFGAGYIAYATFIISYLGAEGMGGGEISAFWVLLGLASIAAAFAWGPMLTRLRGGRGPATVLAVVLAGTVLPIVAAGPVAAFASAVLFGGSFLAVVTAVTALAQRTVPDHAITAAVGALTAAFALGQCAGPILAGVLSDGPAGTRAGFLLSTGILAAAASVSVIQPEHRNA